MNILAEPFWVPKDGNREDEYEDAFWPGQRQECSPDQLRFAIADGATESSFARRWAGLLVDAVGTGQLSASSFLGGLANLRGEWHQWISGKILPWFAEEKARRGAFAAFLALEVSAPEQGQACQGEWRAVACGDSCMFHMRDNHLLTRFPIEDSSEFNSSPYLLGSLEAEGESLENRMLRETGSWARGDRFFLMTDALAAWFLSTVETGGNAWDAIDALTGPAPFAAWIGSLREQRLIRNDDCTLLRLRIL